jgi:BA14K-like protein
MTKIKTATILAFLSVLASPVLAQDAGPLGPGSRYGLEPEPDQQAYRGSEFGPFDAAAGIVGGAVDAAGEIATAPFRASGADSYAMMNGNDSYCAQRYRSYDPQTGTFMGYDGRRRSCR